MMKTAVLAVLMVILVTAILPQRAEAAATVASGTSGATSWVITDDYVMTITGKGAMSDYLNSDKTPWCNYRGWIETIVIGEGVTHIGNYAFTSSFAETVTIPDSVTSIGKHSFAGTPLTQITLPAKLASIGDGAFRESDLTTITLPASLNSLGEQVFLSCYDLTEIRVDAANVVIPCIYRGFSGIWLAGFYPFR